MYPGIPEPLKEQRHDTKNLCVVAAAILQDDVIWSVPAPGRHHHVIRYMHDCGVVLTAPMTDQGFLLSNGRFCMRPGAKRVAIAAGQYKPATDPRLEGLYSEDLW